MKVPRSLIVTGCALAACFGIWVWPTAWTYDRIDGHPVRTHRFTGRVQRLTLDGWVGTNPEEQKPASNLLTTPSENPTSEQLAAVEGKLGFNGNANSRFEGELYNSSAKPISGTVVIHIIVKSKPGYPKPPKGFALDNLADRRIREVVNWPPQHATYVSINPAWQFDPEHEDFEWHLEGVAGELVFSEPGAKLFKIRDREYQVDLSGTTYDIDFSLGFPSGWPSTETYKGIIKGLSARIKEGSARPSMSDALPPPPAGYSELPPRPVEQRGAKRRDIFDQVAAELENRKKAKTLIDNAKIKYPSKYGNLSDEQVARKILEDYPTAYPELRDYKSKR